MSHISCIKKIFKYIKNHKVLFWFSIFCAAITGICRLVFPMIIRFVSELSKLGLDKFSTEILVKIIFLYLVFQIMNIVASYYKSYIGRKVGAKIENDMRKDLFLHLQKLSCSYYENTKTGDLISRVTTDLLDIAEFLHSAPEEIVILSIKVVSTLLFMGMVNIWFLIDVSIAIPLMIMVSVYFNKKLHIYNKKLRFSISKMTSKIENVLLGVQVTKSFANEDIEKNKFEKDADDLLNCKISTYKFGALLDACGKTFEGIAYTFFIIIGAIFIMNGKMSAGDFMENFLYMSILLAAINRFLQYSSKYQHGMACVERFVEIMSVKEDIVDSENAVSLSNVKGNISFKNVNFSYYKSNKKVFSNFNLNVKSGEHITVIGESGSGKTTLCKLLIRLYDVVSGEITIDGINIKNITHKSLNENIGVMEQDVYLFSGTIAENIAYGKPNASRKEIIEAAKKVNLDTFIESLENSYDTFIGDRGERLSGGQRQRIGIARLFLKKPSILILDEATSALDDENKKIIMSSIRDLSKNITTFIITHDMMWIKNSSMLLVLGENKDICEENKNENKIIRC